MLNEALDRRQDGLLVGLGFLGAAAQVQRLGEQIDDAHAVAEHVLGVLCRGRLFSIKERVFSRPNLPQLTPVDGRLAAPTELTQDFVGDEGFHHLLDVALVRLGLVHFLVKPDHLWGKVMCDRPGWLEV